MPLEDNERPVEMQELCTKLAEAVAILIPLLPCTDDGLMPPDVVTKLEAARVALQQSFDYGFSW